MKKISLLIALCALVRPCFSQFEGSLTYKSVHGNQINATYVQSGSKARIDATVYPLVAGVPDTSKPNVQNTVLFDFNKNVETHLAYATKIAATMPLMALTMENALHLTDKDVTVQLVGPEKVGNFSCQHFIIIVRKEKKEVWITQDLGAANMFIFPNFVYYPPGCIESNKLIAAGGIGIVVKAISGPAVTTLESFRKAPVRVSIFDIPSGYAKVDQSSVQPYIK